MEQQTQKGGTSWTIVIVMFILFWPIGIILLIQKLGSDKSSTYNSSIVMNIIGIVLIAMAALMFIALIIPPDSMPGGAIFMLLLFGAPGAWLMYKARNAKIVAVKYKKYIEYIINNEIREIQELSNRLNLSSSVVEIDINEMISKGLLGQARLNLNAGLIYFPEPKMNIQQSNSEKQETQTTRSTNLVTVSCPGCGANNHMDVFPSECEYCGTIINR